MWKVVILSLIGVNEAWGLTSAPTTHCMDYVNASTAVVSSRSYGSVDCIAGDVVLFGRYINLGEKEVIGCLRCMICLMLLASANVCCTNVIVFVVYCLFTHPIPSHQVFIMLGLTEQEEKWPLQVDNTMTGWAWLLTITALDLWGHMEAITSLLLPPLKVISRT